MEILKNALKLAHLITKNTNGIKIQIYACLICYLLLQLVEVPDVIGNKLLDKSRYLQAFMCEKISYIHWFKELVFNC